MESNDYVRLEWEAKDKVANYQRRATQARLETEFSSSQASGQSRAALFPFVVGIAGVLVWLVVR